jgi:hypothetical protein
MSTYTQHYSNFIGVDLSSDPRAVARNRLAYAVNMWRDYESEQGEAIETFPGFRRLVRDLGAVHGLFAYRAKSGEEYLIVHAGKRLYSFESEAIAVMDDVNLTEKAALDKVELEDGDSQGFIFNNNLYILDGKHFVVVSSVTDQSGATSVTASEIDAYVPTTYFDGKPLEQRNMLVDEAYQINNNLEAEETPMKAENFLKVSCDTTVAHYTGIKDNWETTDVVIYEKDNAVFVENFNNLKSIKRIYITVKNFLYIKASTFQNLPNLEEVVIYVTETEQTSSTIFISRESPLDVMEENELAFFNCPKLKEVSIKYYAKAENMAQMGHIALPAGIIAYDYYEAAWGQDVDELASVYKYRIDISEMAEDIISITNYRTGEPLRYIYKYEYEDLSGARKRVVKKAYISDFNLAYIGDNGGIEYDNKVKALLSLHPLHFSTIENVKNFHEGNPDYEGTGIEAINGCTKSAVFDGRIFLTGNPALPNTVFYSNRNLTGANDPTYFGAYNYFNDGDGNTPNVDLLSTPSMLMVLKNNTVQDGSVYYHVGEFNTHEDEIIRNLVPRIYPSTSGAAGLGSSGRTVPGTTACNFLDDPVFLSTRGLEGVGKQLVNAERNLTHRSSNVDRFLIKEDLSRASIAEWKGYLVICCDGRFYLADSRQMHQHPDGSYQYEWYYLEGLGCWDEYSGGYRYINDWFEIDDNGNTLEQCTLVDGRLIGEAFATSDGVFVGDTGDITVYSAQKPDGSQFYFYAHGNLALETVDEERCGVGEFYPARKIVVVGERLFFGTADGDVCVINTDKRGVPDYVGQNLERDRITAKWYSFHGVAYPSECVTTLDDCSKKSLAKGTVPGTTVARFKMVGGSRCKISVSLNGRDFKKIDEAFAERFDLGDLKFDNFSFAENEDLVMVLRELTRNWTDKQYSFVSDGFREPFGLYEISYLYTVKGKIRKTFALVERK